MAEITIAAGTHIGFSANKTKQEAVADAKSNRMNIVRTKELFLNGQRIGLTDNEADYLQRKVSEEYNSKAALSVSCSPAVLDAAAPAAVTVTVRTNWSGAPADADELPKVNYQPSSGSPAVDVVLSKSSTGVYTGVIKSLSAGVTLNCTATIHGVAKSAAPVIQMFHKIRYGVSTADTLTAVPEDFKSKGPQSNAAGTYDFAFKVNTYGFILVPRGVSLPGSMQGDSPSGVEGPLPVPFLKQSDLTVSGVTYTVLRIASKQAESVHNVVFK